jgi:hypothetical protein
VPLLVLKVDGEVHHVIATGPRLVGFCRDHGLKVGRFTGAFHPRVDQISPAKSTW